MNGLHSLSYVKETENKITLAHCHTSESLSTNLVLTEDQLTSNFIVAHVRLRSSAVSTKEVLKMDLI